MESNRIKATKGKVEMRSREVKCRIMGVGRDQHIQLRFGRPPFQEGTVVLVNKLARQLTMQ